MWPQCVAAAAADLARRVLWVVGADTMSSADLAAMATGMAALAQPGVLEGSAWAKALLKQTE
jgi:hypothetical protein